VKQLVFCHLILYKSTKKQDKKLSDNYTIKKGDMIWVKLKGPANDYGYGEVEDIWYDESAKSFLYTFYCLVNGGTRIGDTKNIIKNPSGRMNNKLLISRKEYQEIVKEFYRK